MKIMLIFFVIAVATMISHNARMMEAYLEQYNTADDALALFSVNNGGRYPDTLEVLVVPDENGESYLDEIPLDPWGNDYVYEPHESGTSYRLSCYGSDGAPGGEGEAADTVITHPRR